MFKTSPIMRAYGGLLRKTQTWCSKDVVNRQNKRQVHK